MNGVRMSTAQFRKLLMPVDREAMCWEAVLAAFDVKTPHADTARSPSWILDHLITAGWVCKHVKLADFSGAAALKARPTLAAVMPHIARGNWLLFTSRHVIAVRHGVITDTVGHERTVKRRIHAAWKLTPARDASQPSCGCADPVVFGHMHHVLEVSR